MTKPVVPWGEAYARKSHAFSSTPYWKAEAYEVIKSLWGQKTAPRTILDVGCNTGRFLEELEGDMPESNYYRYVGMDVNTDALFIAKRLHEGSKWQPQFVQSIAQLPDESVDAVAMIHVLPQVVDLDTTLKEIWHVMARKAKFAVVIHNPWFDRIVRLKNVFNKYTPDKTMQREPTMAELRQIMWQAGFNEVSCIYFGAGFGMFKRRIIWVGEKA